MTARQLTIGLRLVGVVIIVLGLMWFTAADLMVSGQLQDSYSFRHRSPHILPLAPKARIGDITQQNGVTYTPLIDDPTYFDIRLPRPVETITLWVTVRAEPSTDIGIAAFYNKDAWQYDRQTVTDWQQLDDGWQRGRVTFDMTDKRFAWQKYQFMISIPQLKNSDAVVDIAQIELLVQRPPLTWQRVVNRLGL